MDTDYSHQPEIVLLGVNHEVATVAVREKAAFAASQIPHLLESLTNELGFSEAVILSTCNRSEVYAVSSRASDVRKRLEDFFRAACPTLTEEELAQFYFHRGDAAARHLFAVAAGLNSLVLGEPQILGQVKDAYQQAHCAGVTGLYLNRLFHVAFQAAKRVRSETAIAEGAVSVPYAAVKLAQKIFKDLKKCRVLLIGSGEMGELVARHVKKSGASEIFVANRTPEKARRLAERLNGQAWPFEQIHDLLPRVDLIIGATGAREYILTREDVHQALSARGTRSLVMIDIAVPRNFDPDINRLDTVFLSDIDALEAVVQDNLERRQAAVKEARQIIEEMVEEFRKWRASLQFKPTIISLQKKLEEIREQEVRRHCRHATPEELEMIERVTRGMVNKILALPVLKMHDYSHRNGDARQLIHLIQELFDLESHER